MCLVRCTASEWRCLPPGGGGAGTFRPCKARTVRHGARPRRLLWLPRYSPPANSIGISCSLCGRARPASLVQRPTQGHLVRLACRCVDACETHADHGWPRRCLSPGAVTEKGFLGARIEVDLFNASGGQLGSLSRAWPDRKRCMQVRVRRQADHARQSTCCSNRADTEVH